MTPLRTLLLAWMLTLLAGCVASAKPPLVVGFAFPPVPADIRTCFKGVVAVPAKNLSVAEVETLWKQDRVRVVVNKTCGERFILWYEDLKQRGGAHAGSGQKTD